MSTRPKGTAFSRGPLLPLLEPAPLQVAPWLGCRRNRRCSGLLAVGAWAAASEPRMGTADQREAVTLRIGNLGRCGGLASGLLGRKFRPG